MEDYDGEMGGEMGGGHDHDMDFARAGREGGASGFKPKHQLEDGEVLRQQDTLADDN